MGITLLRYIISSLLQIRLQYKILKNCPTFQTFLYNRIQTLCLFSLLNSFIALPKYIKYIMSRIHNTFKVVFLLTVLTTSSYLEFSLVRSSLDKKGFQHAPIVCKNETALNGDAQYNEICYHKDISYNIPFIFNQNHFFMAADLTIPIGWVKSPECKIQSSDRKCHRKVQTLAQQVRAVKKKITNRLNKKKQVALKQDAIIEGSSSIIRGQIERSKSISFITTDSSRLSNFLELILLGLFVYGQKDHLELTSTNFINATKISDNLNTLSDGAISLRFDQSSQNSFLDEIFNYVRSAQKTVTFYLGFNNTITIGDITAKYTQNGYSTIEWIDMREDEGFGKLPTIIDIGIEDREDTQDELSEQFTAVFTLSASYIGLPQAVLKSVFSRFMPKQIKCAVNDKTLYLECTAVNKKKLQNLKQKSIFFSFWDKNINLKIQKLVLEQQGKKITLNIKKSFNNRVILGEPIFLQYFIAFDFSQNKIGFAPKRITFDQNPLNALILTRLLCLSLIIGCVFLIFNRPCQFLFKFGYNKDWRNTLPDSQSRKLRQYSPIQQNPYDDIKGKIQEVLGTEKDVEGI